MFFWWICGRESVLPVLFLRHLSSAPWSSLAFSMIQQMLAIWSLVPLPLLKPGWTPGISRFMYCWSLNQDNHNGVIIHLEPDILECVVKWALESITTNKASGGNGIPVKPFQILKDDAVKVLHSICQQIWKTLQWPQDWKRPIFIPIPKKGNAKECSNYHTIALISHLVK